MNKMREVKVSEIKDRMRVLWDPINTSAYKWFENHLAECDGKYYLLEVSGVYWSWSYCHAYELTLEEVKQYFPGVPLKS